MNISLPKELLYSAYRFSAAHTGSDGSTKRVHGTCFYVRPNKETFAVTNKHNFFLSHADPKYVGYSINALVISGYFGVDQFAECDFAGQTLSFATPFNGVEDVIVIDLTDVPFKFRRKRKPEEDPTIKTTSLSPIAVDISMLAASRDFIELNPGWAIAFPSYPELFDLNGIRPIMRTGTIASDPESDYQAFDQEPARRMVYEAHSTQGSSGSPVFALKENSELIVVGVNAGHLKGTERSIGPIHSGLSFCYKSPCILEAIEQLRARKQDTAQ